VTRSDPLLQGKKTSNVPGETHHATTSSEARAQGLAAADADVPQFHRIDIPPSDYLTTKLAVDKVPTTYQSLHSLVECFD